MDNVNPQNNPSYAPYVNPNPDRPMNDPVIIAGGFPGGFPGVFPPTFFPGFFPPGFHHFHHHFHHHFFHGRPFGGGF